MKWYKLSLSYGILITSRCFSSFNTRFINKAHLKLCKKPNIFFSVSLWKRMRSLLCRVGSWSGRQIKEELQHLMWRWRVNWRNCTWTEPTPSHSGWPLWQNGSVAFYRMEHFGVRMFSFKLFGRFWLGNCLWFFLQSFRCIHSTELCTYWCICDECSPKYIVLSCALYC